MGAGRLCQLCLQIDSRGRDLGRVQRSSGGGRWGAAVHLLCEFLQEEKPSCFPEQERVYGCLSSP